MHRLNSAKEVLKRFRTPLTIAGAILMIGGSVWSIQKLGLHWSQLALAPLLANLIVAQLLILLVAAVSLRISGQVAGAQISLRNSLSAVSYANFAELLPIPGGAMVRVAALKVAGARLDVATGVITLTAILMLAMLVTLSAFILVSQGLDAAWFFAIAGIVGSFIPFALIAHRTNLRLAALVFIVRVLTILIGIFALKMAFDAISQSNTTAEVAILTVSSTLGSAVAIAPSGLGISETIAAGLAVLTTIPPAAAFLAIALNRALGLLLSLLVVLVLHLTQPAQVKDQ